MVKTRSMNINVKNSKKVKIIKWIINILIILFLLGILALNFLIPKDFNYFYDIGNNDNYLTPLNRISESYENETNYRLLKENLVYFNSEIPLGSKDIKVQVRINNNFPNNSIMSIGVKDKEEWHYYYKQIYNPSLDLLSSYENIDNIYRINENIPLDVTQENIVIASDKEINKAVNDVSDYNNQETIISTSLRGGHKFLVYAEDYLKLEVKKQDINWYNGSDVLEISLLDLDNNLIKNITIEDDGIIEVNTNEKIIQDGILETSLSKGIYKLIFSDFDGLIKEIKINTNKIIVVNNLFLANSEIYKIPNKKSNIYFKSFRNSTVEIKTWHNSAFQNLTVNNNIVELNKRVEPIIYFINKEDNYIISDFNDILIEYPGYFSFNKENYFEPFKQRTVLIKNNKEYLKNNVDFIITDYKKPIIDNDWIITETSFNIKKDNLFIKDNKLSLVFNIPHLSNDEFKNNTIPIDWINITVSKPGLIKK